MSLPPLLKHVYNHGTEEVIRRGKRIYHTAGVQMLDVDHLLQQVRFKVRNDQYYNYYTVTINGFSDARALSVRCQCPYNLSNICRHEVAALFQLNDLVQSGAFRGADVRYDQSHTTVRMRQVTDQFLSVFTAKDSLEWAEDHATAEFVNITGKKLEKVELNVLEGKKEWKVMLRQNEERYFDTSCECAEVSHPLCRHKAAAFLHILRVHGSQYFAGLQNWDAQKNKLLGLYGYSLSDDLSGKFEFIYKEGKPFLKLLDLSIKKVSDTRQKQEPVPDENAAKPDVKKDPEQLALVLTQVSWYPFLQFQLASGKPKADSSGFQGILHKLELQQYVEAGLYKEDDRDLIPLARKLLPEEILKYLKKNLPFGDFIDDYEKVLKAEPEEEIKEQVWEYLLPKYKAMLERMEEQPWLFLHKKEKSITAANITTLKADKEPASPALFITPKGKNGAVIHLRWKQDEDWVVHSAVEMLNPALLLQQNVLKTIEKTAILPVIEAMLPSGTLTVSAKDWPQMLDDKVMHWRKALPVHFDPAFTLLQDEEKPSYRLYLQERDNTLVLKPAFVYGDIEIRWGTRGDALQTVKGKVKLTPRNQHEEDKLLHLLQHLHKDMKQSMRGHFYYLPAEAVLADNWFFRFIDALKENKIELHGLDDLRKLRISTYRPKTEVHVSSGIDWFDADVEVAFGDQQVSIAEVKAALAQRQQYVPLADGSIGLLPQDWLKKYALLVKMGESKGGKLRLKKIHFNVLGDLLNTIDEETVLQELEAKKEKLHDIVEQDFSNLPLPSQLQATLRPYQHSGYQWLGFLKEAGWGGILADDMGLGKTVQTLAFLQQYKNENPDATFLVVCPTTLMYNWEAEIKKFTPELTYFMHHGPKRPSAIKDLISYTIIITTYGTMRSDIKLLREVPLDYAVLDESQAIKNPQSMVAKASLLLNAKHRLALSGTPVQNNTFDLYAQMNFLNPGMLGSREFFMNEFATPIDKFSEDEVKQQLKKLTYPFMLRRTKEQVAKDLPDKTEMTLYCEMGKEQRRIYDAYRNSYKTEIMGLIDKQGIERSTMHILQGLTRLRQICDSPAILNEEEKFGNHSIKLEELTREINENVGEHKALVFSQFLGMLALIRKELEALQIPYAYFDGSTASSDRQKAVDKFQNDPDCRVFLISLKAGGIGLNLTAADYVYIVDPWWNPAVEQQAIDRTHRIGQTKNIFAYRLICKDTIEEKMLLLQERKKALAADLVSDDSATLKKLTRADLDYLLS